MRLLIIVILGMIVLPSYAQIKFEKGYFINNTGEKTECLIRNQDWRKNPDKFLYKFTEAEEPKEITIQEVQSFQVYTFARYERHRVDIDKSPDQMDKMNDSRAPNFEVDTVFLKILVEGEALLYEYAGNQFTRFFYRLNDETPQQLVYKRFMVKGTEIKTNTEYKSQLWENFKCENTSLDLVGKTDYNRKELTRYFVAYNQCFDQPVVTTQKQQEEASKKDLLHLSLRAGLRLSKVDYNAGASTVETDFGTELSWRLGAELELFLPFNRNKWSILFEPSFQSLNVEAGNEFNVVNKVDYQSLELPLGIRYSLYIDSKNRFYLNSLFLIDVPFNSTFERFNTNLPIFVLDLNTVGNFVFGAGFTIQDRVNVELRLHTARELLNNSITSTADLNNFEFILGFKLF